MTILDTVYETVVKRNPGEVEFHQAVKEVLESLEPLISQLTQMMPTEGAAASAIQQPS